MRTFNLNLSMFLLKYCEYHSYTLLKARQKSYTKVIITFLKEKNPIHARPVFHPIINFFCQKQSVSYLQMAKILA